MSLYQEQTSTETVTTTTYVRSNLITVDNPLGLPPSITFIEEMVEQVGDEPAEAIGDTGSVSKTLTPENSATTFDLLNPTDNSVIGSANYQDFQVMLYSLYIHLATERDNA